MSDTSSRSRSWLPWVLAGAVVVVVLGLIAAGIAFVVSVFRPDPDFVSLSLVPDPALRGTVAYFDDESRCVRVVAASGQPQREVYCVESQAPSDAEREGKDVGVDIEWLPDDRLQLTLYRMVFDTSDLDKAAQDPPDFEAAWRRIIDVRTGSVEEVPAEEFAGAVPDHPCETTSPAGERIVTESNDGHAVVTLITPAGERTLLDVRGGAETYGISEACWAPGYQWIATSDTRLLVITTGEPPLTRALTPPMTTFYGYDALAWYSITDADILTDSPASG